MPSEPEARFGSRGTPDASRGCANELRLVWPEVPARDGQPAAESCADNATLTQRVLLADPSTHARLDAWWPALENEWRINLVQTVNGRLTGGDTTSDSLTNRVDRLILRHLRQAANAVLVGATTFRRDFPRSVDTRTVVLTRTGNLAGHRLDAAACRAVTVVCPPDAVERALREVPGAAILERPTDRAGAVDMVALRQQLVAERGIASVVVEGGGLTIGECLAAGVIDEICLSEAPVVGAQNGVVTPGGAVPEHWRRVLLALDNAGTTYTRLRQF